MRSMAEHAVLRPEVSTYFESGSIAERLARRARTWIGTVKLSPSLPYCGLDTQHSPPHAVVDSLRFDRERLLIEQFSPLSLTSPIGTLRQFAALQRRVRS